MASKFHVPDHSDTRPPISSPNIQYSTTTLTSTFTVPAVPTAPPPSPEAPPASESPVIFSTIPAPDPNAAKLIPVLVVTEYYVTVNGDGGTETAYTTTHVTPNAVLTLPLESGTAAAGAQNNIGELRAMGWESWSGKERWSVLAAVAVGMALMMAGAGWLLWVRFGRARAMPRTASVATKGGAGDDRMKQRWPVGPEQRTRSGSRRPEPDRRGRRASDARYQMSGALGDAKTEMSERAGTQSLHL